MQMESPKLHVAVFPWLAFGHIIPFLELSKLIAQKGHKISFISTPRNIDRLPKLDLEFADSITFVKIQLPQVNGLPPNAEATMDINNDDMPYLKQAFDGMEPELTCFLEVSLPDWIIHDFAPYWLPPVAARIGISKAYYSNVTAWFLVFVGTPNTMINGTDPRTKPEDFMVPPKWVPFQTKVAYKRNEVDWISASTKHNAKELSGAFRLGVTMQGTDAFIVRQCNEFQGAWLNLLGELHNKKVIPLGLMPAHVENNTGDNNNESWAEIKEWLDAQNKGSVLYVAMGSEVSLSQAQVTELALGLEISGVPFFWALRKPSGSSESERIDVPDGYEERVKGRGVVWKSWAPQMKILSHESVGCFLTHCGWGSCIEGLMSAHPLIMLPFLVDQGLNARVLEDTKVGMEVPRNEQDGSYTGDSVAETIRLVMTGDQSKKFKEKAKDFGRVLGDRELHERYFQDFIQYLEKQRGKHQESLNFAKH